MICHQRLLRDRFMAQQPRPVQKSLDGCEVRSITREQAASVILKYEWLGTMPKVGRAYYGLWDGEELVGVACFGNGMGTNARALCGVENIDKAICLERGACVHWAHPHAASFLISRACKQAADDHGWRVFFAYSDQEAGEVGVVYQACNWLYLGQGLGRGQGETWRNNWYSPSGERYTSRRLRALKARTGKTGAELLADGWERRRHYDKGKYVHFEGDRRERKALLKALRYPPQPYPKRTGGRA